MRKTKLDRAREEVHALRRGAHRLGEKLNRMEETVHKRQAKKVTAELKKMGKPK